MKLSEIKDQVMFQANYDIDDLPDFEPHLTDYINEGYDILVMAYRDQHVSTDSLEYVPLKNPADEPKLPEYAHRGLADYATYLVYRNGNMVKQNRGMSFYSAFQAIVIRLKGESAGKVRNFRNLYT